MNILSSLYASNCKYTYYRLKQSPIIISNSLLAYYITFNIIDDIMKNNGT